MPYCQLFYHLIWTTRGRGFWIHDHVEAEIFELIRGKAKGLGASIFALNGLPDHVHLACAVPPKIAIATFVGQVKGVSSTKINQMGLVDHTFAWQGEYGAFSFDRKRLPRIVAYIERQKEHHRDGTTIPALERDQA